MPCLNINIPEVSKEANSTPKHLLNHEDREKL